MSELINELINIKVGYELMEKSEDEAKPMAAKKRLHGELKEPNESYTESEVSPRQAGEDGLV